MYYMHTLYTLIVSTYNTHAYYIYKSKTLLLNTRHVPWTRDALITVEYNFNRNFKCRTVLKLIRLSILIMANVYVLDTYLPQLYKSIKLMRKIKRSKILFQPQCETSCLDNYNYLYPEFCCLMYIKSFFCVYAFFCE